MCRTSGSNEYVAEVAPHLTATPGDFDLVATARNGWSTTNKSGTQCVLLRRSITVTKGGLDTKWVLVGSILGGLALVGVALLLVRRHHEQLMHIAVMLVTEVVRLSLSLGLEIADIITEYVPSTNTHTWTHARSRLHGLTRSHGRMRSRTARIPQWCPDGTLAVRSAYSRANRSSSTNRLASPLNYARLTPSSSSSRWLSLPSASCTA
jgi:hypothetical protein